MPKPVTPDQILSLLDSFPDVGLYAKEVEGERIIARNERTQFFTASTMKVILAIALYRKLEREGKNDALEVEFREDQKVAGSGILHRMHLHRTSLYNHLALTLTISDNTATDVLWEFVGDETQEVVKLLGLSGTHLRMTSKQVLAGLYNMPETVTPQQWDAEEVKRRGKYVKGARSLDLAQANVSTPYDLFLVLDELMHPALISKESAGKILALMKACDAPLLLPSFPQLGYRVEIAHKAGWIYSIKADMGIVFSKKPFYLVIMGKGMTAAQEKRLSAVGQKITKLLVRHFSS